jgi:thioredoxin reductase (NADPH)
MEDGTLESVDLASRRGDRWTVEAQHMFLFIGADPNTQWLDRRIALDEKGFVATGRASGLPLETSSPGVFAIGDARSGSIKRVAAGVGEGAAAVAQIHAYLAALWARPRAVEPA